MTAVLIVDSHDSTRNAIKALLQNQPDFTFIYEADCGAAASEIALSIRPNLVFIDTELPDIAAIEFARELPPECGFVFLSSSNKYAISAFELNAIDYLIRPFGEDRLLKSLDRARDTLALNNKAFRDRIAVRNPGRIRLIDVDLIKFITGAGNYAEIHLADGKSVLHRETLSTLEEQLDPTQFARIHRSTIVNRVLISEVRSNEKGDYLVTLDCGESLTLSRRSRNKLESIF